MSIQRNTPEEMLADLGDSLKSFRIQRGLDQKQLAARAGVSLGALSHLENGQGSTLLSFVKVLRALGLQNGLQQLVPTAVLDPLSLTRQATPRQRAKHTRTRKPAKPALGSPNGNAQDGQ
jgi:transcriptional regulator with XRE-family HTH domain